MTSRKFVAAVLMTALCALAAFAECTQEQIAALEKLDRDWATWGDNKNKAELEKLYADDFRNITPLAITGKKQAIEDTMNAPATPAGQEIMFDRYMITCTPTTATVTHRNTVKTMKDGKHSMAYSRSVHFFEKRNGRWQVVSSTGANMADDASVAVNTEFDGAKAYKNGNIAWFKEHLADNYISVGLDGKVSNKKEVLTAIQNNKMKFDKMKLSDLTVRQEGDMVLLSGIYHVKGTDANGKAMDMKTRFTRTLVKKDGDWVALASHASVVPESELVATNPN